MKNSEMGYSRLEKSTTKYILTGIIDMIFLEKYIFIFLPYFTSLFTIPAKTYLPHRLNKLLYK